MPQPFWPNPRGLYPWEDGCHPEVRRIQKGVLKRGSWRHRAIDSPAPKCHHEAVEPPVEESRKRITARVSDRVRDTLEQAAELLGSTVNQFVVQTAYVEAQRVIERESVIRLSQKDARKVLALLDNPPKPNKRLKAAVKAFRGTVRA
jgi:uncharacterized protein (DUF1778 family)